MKQVPMLPDNIENIIKQFIQRKLSENELRMSFPNQLLRDDVLALLGEFCTVVYYPLENESNNGFHVNIPCGNGDRQDFVFINTAQAMEKQIFTAAHELGHIWKVDEELLPQVNLENSIENHELIINRFAAALLIPEENFEEVLSVEFRKLANPDHTISLLNMYKLIVILMNHFFVPMKAIVLRLRELRCIEPSDADLLLGRNTREEGTIDDIIQKLVQELGFTRLLKASNKKWIDGLSEKLDLAEEMQALPQEKIEHIRDEFGLPFPVQDEINLSNTISFSPQGDVNIDAN